MNIGIYTGYWSTNIGNSFFQLGAEYLIKKVFPNANVFPIADEAGYIKPNEGNPSFSFNPILEMDLDVVAILGPFITPEIQNIILPTIKQLKQKGIRIWLMGVGMMDYSVATIEKSKKILSDIDPEIFITRDRETYDAFHSAVKNPYDGIDLGFFSSDVYSGTGVNGKYVTLNFDQLPEPIIQQKKESDQFTFMLNDVEYGLNFNKIKKKLYEKDIKYYNFLDRMLFPQNFNQSIGEYKIIRTEHRYNPIFLKKVYSLPNTFASDVPYPYWAIYKNSALTISNRVHACVATLSFGNPAWLFTNSPRAFLLDRVGAKDIKLKPTTIDLDMLQKEKENLIQFVRDSIKL